MKSNEIFFLTTKDGNAPLYNPKKPSKFNTQFNEKKKWRQKRNQV